MYLFKKWIPGQNHPIFKDFHEDHLFKDWISRYLNPRLMWSNLMVFKVMEEASGLGGWYSKKIKVKTQETILFYDMMRSQTHM